MESSTVQFARRAVRSIWVRALFTVTLLALVAIQIDFGTAAGRLEEGQWGWFVGAVALLLVAMAVGAWRWHVLLDAADVPSSKTETLRAFAIGVFSSNFLPTSFGGDAVRAWIVGRSRGAVVRALTSVAVDRASALGCLIAVGWLLAATEPSAVPGSLALALLAASVAGSAVGAVLLVAVFRRGAYLRRLPTQVVAWGSEGAAVLRAYLRSPRVGWAVVGLGCAYQLIAIAFVWMLTRVVDVNLPLATVAVAFPLILLANLIPFSIAGFGVREGAFVVVLGVAGVSATDATLISLLTAVALALSGLPGALALLVRGEGLPRSDTMNSVRSEAPVVIGARS